MAWPPGNCNDCSSVAVAFGQHSIILIVLACNFAEVVVLISIHD